jgi:hypothetical protein
LHKCFQLALGTIVRYQLSSFDILTLSLSLARHKESLSFQCSPPGPHTSISCLRTTLKLITTRTFNHYNFKLLNTLSPHPPTKLTLPSKWPASTVTRLVRAPHPACSAPFRKEPPPVRSALSRREPHPVCNALFSATRSLAEWLIGRLMAGRT